MAVKFHTSGDAILSYCTVFSMYVTLWNMERQNDTLLLLLYYSDFFYLAQYACVKLAQGWQDFNSDTASESTESVEEDITLGESLPYFTTPLSLLPFHVVFKMGLDRGCFYQFVCLLRFFTLYQGGRIHFDWKQGNSSTPGHKEAQPTMRITSDDVLNSTPQEIIQVQVKCRCNCRFRSNVFENIKSL